MATDTAKPKGALLNPFPILRPHPTPHQRERSPGLVVVEVFAGTSSHSKLVRDHLAKHSVPKVNVSCISIDIDRKHVPDICGDMRAWGSTHTAALKARFPNRHFIVHGSPPCQDYSQANTTSKRPLEERLPGADMLVLRLLDLYRDLGDRALVLMVENPGTGRLVKREVRHLPKGQDLPEMH